MYGAITNILIMIGWSTVSVLLYRFVSNLMVNDNKCCDNPDKIHHKSSLMFTNNSPNKVVSMGPINKKLPNNTNNVYSLDAYRRKRRLS